MTAVIILSLLLSQTPVCESKKIFPELEMKVLPIGQQCTLKDNNVAQCYNIEEFKSLIDADAELRALRAKVEEYKKALAAQDEVVKQLNIIISTYTLNQNILEERLDRADANWKKATERDVKSTIGMLAASTTIALSAGISIGVASILVLQTIRGK